MIDNTDGVELDAGRVINRLGRRIGELEVENAKLDALVQQLAGRLAEADVEGEPEKPAP